MINMKNVLQMMNFSMKELAGMSSSSKLISYQDVKKIWDMYHKF